MIAYVAIAVVVVFSCLVSFGFGLWAGKCSRRNYGINQELSYQEKARFVPGSAPYREDPVDSPEVRKHLTAAVGWMVDQLGHAMIGTAKDGAWMKAQPDGKQDKSKAPWYFYYDPDLSLFVFKEKDKPAVTHRNITEWAELVVASLDKDKA